MEPALGVALGSAHVRWTGRAHGHVGLPRPHDDAQTVAARRARIVDAPWAWLRQVHGAHVVVADGAQGLGAQEGDALVTMSRDVALAVFTADCAPVALAGDGVVGLAHAGWRGLVAGVLQSTVNVMRTHGAGTIVAALGPCIRAPCYEFGAADLDEVAAVLGDDVRATTAWGTPALDLAAGVRRLLADAGVVLTVDAGACTACSPVWFSARARHETERQATLVWMP